MGDYLVVAISSLINKVRKIFGPSLAVVTSNRVLSIIGLPGLLGLI